MALAMLDPGRPLVVEAESSRIGNLSIPKQLWATMCAAPRVRIAAPLAARADYLSRAYADVTTDQARLSDVINRLRALHPADTIADWLRLAETGAFRALATGLMDAHYDPRYEKHRSRFTPEREAVVEATSLAPDALDPLATRIAAAVRDIAGNG